MNFSTILSAEISTFDWYAWVILPIIIFIARVFDVTLGTLRIIFVSRGRRNLAPLLGFFEVLIWVVVIGQIVQNLHSVTAYIGYAGGFAAGNFVGMWLENRLALGTFELKVMSTGNSDQLAKQIRDAGYGVTMVDGMGSTGPVKLLYIIVKRKHVNKVMTIIHTDKPNAFVTIEEVRSFEKGIFPDSATQRAIGFLGRKSK